MILLDSHLLHCKSRLQSDNCTEVLWMTRVYLQQQPDNPHLSLIKEPTWVRFIGSNEQLVICWDDVYFACWNVIWAVLSYKLLFIHYFLNILYIGFILINQQYYKLYWVATHFINFDLAWVNILLGLASVCPFISDHGAVQVKLSPHISKWMRWNE